MTALLVVSLLSLSVQAHQVKYFWKYDPQLFRHGWPHHSELQAWHKRWHHNHPNPGEGKHLRFHHRLVHAHQNLHYHDVLAKQQGQASWYDLKGEMGACDEPLKGLYAAHPKWKCGSLVSVRAGDSYVFVTILDRGPTGDGRVIDLSKEAFERLADPSDGVIDVKIYRLEP